MTAPMVSWYDETNTTQETAWDSGTIDAGTTGPEKKFLIWNNRGGATPVSDMENCVITTKAQDGSDSGPLVTEKWVEVQVDDLGDPDFTAVGGQETHPIGNGITAQTISGAANDGSLANGSANNCLLTARVAVPATASAGATNYLLRVSYTYV